MHGTDLTLRPAGPEDVSILHDWVNREDSLAGKLATSSAIPYEEHAEWFGRRLADPDTAIWIGEVDGQAVGQVRLQRSSVGFEVDVYVTDSARGRGVATRMLRHARREARARWPGDPLIARVKSDNSASRALFAAAGFKVVARREDHLVYRDRKV